MLFQKLQLECSYQKYFNESRLTRDLSSNCIMDRKVTLILIFLSLLHNGNVQGCFDCEFGICPEGRQICCSAFNECRCPCQCPNDVPFGEFEKEHGKICREITARYTNYAEALRVCSEDVKCIAIAGKNCDKKESFTLCTSLDARTTWTGQCIYRKKPGPAIATSTTPMTILDIPEVDCNKEVTANGTVLTSPGYPSSYPDNAECLYVIRFDEGQTITLEFIEFDLEYEPACSYDWLEVRDGGDEKAPIIGKKLCSNTIPNRITSNGNELFLTFHSDGTGTESGFKIAVWETEMGQTSNEVGQRECKPLDECDFYLWFIENDIIGFPKEAVDKQLKKHECGLDENLEVKKVNCPVELDCSELANESDEKCERFNRPQYIGAIEIGHTDVTDMINNGKIILPPEKRPTQEKYPNLKRGYNILKRNIVTHVEANGYNCWEFYDNPYFSGEKQVVWPGDRTKLEIRPGSVMKVKCPRNDYYEY